MGFYTRRIGICAATLLAVLPCAPGVAPCAARPDGGIWKYAVPPSGIHGEFGNEDPVGLAAGVHIKTDCSMNWRADDGKLYCFTTGTSLLFFEESPHRYLEKARHFYRHHAS